jgi:hypothetical protein
VVRAVAGHDQPRAESIAQHWSVNELLHAYLAQARRDAVEEHRNALVVWAALAPHLRKKTPPPAIPAILKGPD